MNMFAILFSSRMRPDLQNFRLMPRALVALSLLSMTLQAGAAIPLLGPCDPDFSVAGACAPATSKEDRAGAAKPAKPSQPAATPAAPGTPHKSTPAGKVPTEAKPESPITVSLTAEDSCPKSPRIQHLAEAPEVAAPLLSPTALSP